jgi:phosphatidylglycerophosphate synthase
MYSSAAARGGHDFGVRHERELQGFLSRYEKSLLTALAQRLPVSITPDHLTLLGFLGAVVAGLGLALGGRSGLFLWVACLGLLLNWLGDSLDGTLARVRGIERPRYGFFVDHMVDLAAQVAIVVGLGLSPYMRFDVACLALVAYLVMTAYTLIRLHVLGVMSLAYCGIGPTEARAALAAGILLAWAKGELFIDTGFGVVGLYNLMVGTAAVAVLGLVAISALREARVLARTDVRPLPQSVFLFARENPQQQNHSSSSFIPSRSSPRRSRGVA